MARNSAPSKTNKPAELKNAKITLDNGFVNESIEELNRLKEKYHENAIVHYRLGYAYKELKDYDLAIINFKQAKSLNPYNQDYINMITTLVKIQEANGHAEYQRQDYQLSLEYFNKALEYDSTYAPVMYRIGNIYYKIKDYEKAIEMYKKGLSYTEFAPNKYKTLNQLGKFYTKINNDEKALEVFDKVLDLEPDYEQALFEKAKIFKKTGKINDSKILLLKIIENNPAFVRSYELLMDIEKDLTNYDKAMSYGEKCLEFNKNSHTVLARMANTYNEINDFIKGREYAKSALKIKNKYGPALFELGYSEMNLCNKIAAKDAFSKAKLNKSYRKIANDYIKNLDSYMSECE